MILSNAQSWFVQNGSNQCKNMAGSAVSYIGASTLSFNSSSCHYGGSNSGAYHVVIGTGDTAVTYDDYDLADSSIMASDKMKPLVQTASWDKNSGATVTVQWKNTTSSPITIKEVGLAYKLNSTTYSKGANILVSRKVLAVPVTIQPDEVYAFTYRISVKAS